MVAQRQPARTMPLIGSVDRKTHPHLLQPPDFSELINVDLHQPGAIMKRRAYVELGTDVVTNTGALQTPTSMFLVGDRLTIGNNYGQVYERIEGLDKISRTSDDGWSATARAEWLDGVRLGQGAISNGDIAYTNGYELRVVVASGVLLAEWVDSENGAVVHTVSASSPGGARALAIGNTLMLFYQGGANLVVRYVDTDNIPTSVPTATAATDMSRLGFDVTSRNGVDDFAYVVYGTATQVKVLKVSTAGVGSTSATYVAAPTRFAIFYSDANVAFLIAWYDATTTNVHVYGLSSLLTLQSTHAAMATLTNPGRIVLGEGNSSSTRVGLFVERDLSSSEPGVRYMEVLVSGATASDVLNKEVAGMRLLSRPFISGLGQFLVLASAAPYDTDASPITAGTVVLCRATWAADAFDVIGHALYEYTYDQRDPANYYSPASSIVEIGDQRVHMAFGYVSATDEAKYQPARIGWEPKVWGGVDRDGRSFYQHGGGVYCGSETTMCGFPWRPIITALTAVTSGGGALTLLATYQYVAVYEYTDAAGNLHRSPPSAPVSVTLAGTENAVNARVTTLLDHGSVGRIVLHRTQASRTVLYRLTAQSSTTTTSRASNGLWRRIIADEEADTGIADNQILYTQGGARLESYPMPCGGQTVIHKNRIWTLDEFGNIAMSNELVPLEAPSFSPFLIVETAGFGRPTAMVSMDSALLVFGDKKVGVIYGDGPNDAGQGGAFSQIQFIEGTPAGTSNPASVVKTPQGIMFDDAELGIHLLPYGGGVPQFVGARVEEVRGSSEIVGAHVLPDRECAAFTCANGVVLNFWYAQNRWSWDVLPEGDGEGSRAWRASCVSGGRHTVISTGSEPFRQADDLYLEEGEFVPTTITTGWMTFDGLQGLVRIWNLFLLGVRMDACEARLTVWVDRDDSGAGDVYDWNVDSIQGVDGGPVEARAHMRTQQLKAMKIRIVDHDEGGDAATGQGVTWTGLRIDWGGTGKGPRLGRESAVV